VLAVSVADQCPRHLQMLNAFANRTNGVVA
jgi:hypothetical protein